MTVTRKFKKRDLQGLVGHEESELEIISKELVESTRWHLHYDLIFKHEDKLYRTHYQRGATEIQYEYPFEHEDDEIECTEVKPVERTVTVYEDA